jgi:hypothetical protein
VSPVRQVEDGDAATSSMTRSMAGTFAPTPEMVALANRSSQLTAKPT